MVAAKKKATKKVGAASRKTPTKKKASKKRSTRVSKKSVTKKRATKTKGDSISIKDNSQKLDKSKTRSLLVLSRYRFPLPSQYVLRNIARYGGVTAVIIGGFFTLFNLQIITALQSTPQAQLASVSGGTSGCGIVVSVPPAVSPNYPPTCQLSVSKSTINAGEEAQLSWSTTNAERVWIESSICEVEATGSRTVTPSQTTTYTLYAYSTEVGHTGLKTCQKTITVVEQDTQPEPRITFTDSTANEGIADITVTVPLAQEITLLLKSLATNQYTTLGSASKVDDSTWRYSWNTETYPEGAYAIKAVMRNQYGNYDYISTNTYEVVHEEEVVTTETTDTTSTVNTEDSTATEDTESASATEEGGNDTTITTTNNTPTLSLRISSGSVYDGKETISLEAVGVTQIKLYAKNTASLNTVFLGYAYQKDGTDWRFVWDTEKVPDGNYLLYATSQVTSGSVESKSIRVTIDNEPEAEEEEPEATDGTEEESATVELVPDIVLSVPQTSPLSGFVELKVRASSVKWVELYAIPQNSLVLKFLGLAKKTNDSEWTYSWNTASTPNGTYKLYARVKTEYGFTEGERVSVSVRNEMLTTYSAEEEKRITEIHEASKELITITENSDEPELTQEDQRPPAKTTYITPVNTFVETIEADDADRMSVEEILHDYRRQLNELINQLARAERTSDENKLKEVRAQMNELKAEIILKLRFDLEESTIIDQIDAYISQITFELEEIALRNEEILKERMGAKLSEDSDGDGISDFDEVNLYKTNPFVADTDGDGFIDSAEIEGGFDPHDSRSEALIAYESPKDSGVTREELLKVDSIVTLTDEDDTESVGPRALITGKALPNSFVTIYIFSEPIIVTVRTESDGSWRYVFDKELEDGEHEIYVGVTDNAGRIVAKSEPRGFVKTAEAFSVTDVEETPEVAASADSALFSSRALLLIASLAVVSLGLVLILLGFHVSDRKDALVVKRV